MSENDGKYSGEGYTGSRKETYDLIKSLHESGLGYKRIAHHLNSKNITTFTFMEWKGNCIKQIIGISSLLFVMVITFSPFLLFQDLKKQLMKNLLVYPQVLLRLFWRD